MSPECQHEEWHTQVGHVHMKLKLNRCPQACHKSTCKCTLHASVLGAFPGVDPMTRPIPCGSPTAALWQTEVRSLEPMGGTHNTKEEQIKLLQATVAKVMWFPLCC